MFNGKSKSGIFLTEMFHYKAIYICLVLLHLSIFCSLAAYSYRSNLCSKREFYSMGSGKERQLLRIRYLVRVPWTSGWERGRVRSRDSADSTSMYSLQNKGKIKGTVTVADVDHPELEGQLIQCEAALSRVCGWCKETTTSTSHSNDPLVNADRKRYPMHIANGIAYRAGTSYINLK